MKTWAPSLTKSFAVANPIPSVPPVMTAILPSSFLGIVFLRCCRVVTNFPHSNSFVCRESFSEHGSLASGLFFRRFILNHIPVIDQNAVLDADDVCSNPVHWGAKVRKSPVHDHDVSLGHDRSRFVLQRCRDALDEIEQTLTTRCDMSAALNVVGRQKSLRSRVVSPIKQCVECLQYDCLIFLRICIAHCFSSLAHRRWKCFAQFINRAQIARQPREAARQRLLLAQTG